MSFLDAISAFINEETSLYAANISKDRSSKIAANLLLVQNDVVIASDTVVLSSSDARDAWAAKVSSISGVETTVITAAMTKEIVPQAFAAVQQNPSRPSLADGLVDMVKNLLGGDSPSVELSHDLDGTTYARVKVRDHWETYPIKSRDFRSWLFQESFRTLGRYPKGRAADEALETIESIARFEGATTQVYVRLAHVGDAIYLDLADAEGRTVEITAEGWRVLTESSVTFRRPAGMLPLPVPVEGGSLLDFKPFLNVPQDDDIMFILMMSWLIGAFRPRGPYPVLLIQGAQGTAKTSMARMLRSMVDPNLADVRSLPGDERDLIISATNSWCPCFDNLSYIAGWQSDALCRLSTGGGWATRKLYSDAEETIFSAQRPMILTGIGDMVNRSDLLDRSVLVAASTISPDRRRPEAEVWAAFEQARPSLLGAVLNAVSLALRNEDTVTLANLPRLADFAKWVAAAEAALPWEAGQFLRAYDSSRREAHLMALEASVVAQALQALGRHDKSAWKGTATELLSELACYSGDSTRLPKGWPTSPTALSGKLREVLPDLNAVGIYIDFSRSSSSRRITVNFDEWLANQPA